MLSKELPIWKIIITLLLWYPLYGFASNDISKQQEIENLIAGDSELSETDPEQAIKNWERALALSKEIGNDSLTIVIVQRWAYFYRMKEDKESFLRLANDYINLPDKRYDSFVAYRELHLLYAGVYRINMEYDSSLVHAFKLVELDEFQNLPLISAYLTIGNTYKDAKRYDKGHEYASKAYELLKEPLDNVNPISITFWNAYAAAILTEANYGLERYDLASKYYDEFNRHMKLDNKSLKIRTHHYLDAFSTLDTEEDFQKLQQVYKETQQATYITRDGKNHVAFTLAEKYNKAGQKEDAIFYWKAGLGTEESTSNDIYPSKKLFEAYLQLGEIDSALKYNALHEELLQKSYEVESLKTMNELSVKYETAQKDAEISKKKVQLSRLLGGLAFILLLSGTLLFRYYSQRKLAQQELSLLKKDQKLLSIDYILQGQEEERKRIAQDLHDGLGGLLSTAKIKLGNIQKEINNKPQSALINKAEEMVSNAYSEVRRISHNMMPGALVNLGLFAAIEDLADELQTQSDIKVITQWKTEDSGFIDKKKEVLYRIVQESFNNILKHAEANNVKVSMTQNLSGYQLIVKDDGVGFDYEEISTKANGIGLKSLQSRVDYLNGEINIQSSPDQGTHIEIHIPVN